MRVQHALNDELGAFDIEGVEELHVIFEESRITVRHMDAVVLVRQHRQLVKVHAVVGLGQGPVETTAAYEARLRIERRGAA